MRISGLALLAKRAAICAHKRVDRMQNTNAGISGAPPMAKWDTAPVRAVKVIMNTLVPTAVFRSYPSTEVRTVSYTHLTDRRQKYKTAARGGKPVRERMDR